MTTNFDDVGNFHQKFGLDNVTHRGAGKRDVSEDLVQFRIKFLREELTEFIEAWSAHDEAGMFDALLDLVYVAMGTAHLLGYPWEAGWRAVQAANMRKVRATTASDSKRGSTWDVVKPEDWRPPDIARILETVEALRDFIPPTDQCPGCKGDTSKMALREVIFERGDQPTTLSVFCDCGYLLRAHLV